MRKLLFPALVLLSCSCNNREKGPEATVSDFQAADVASIEVTVKNRPDKGPNLGPFVASPDDYDRILRLVKNGSEDPSPAKWQVLGLLRIHMKTMDKATVHLYWTGDKTGAFKIVRQKHQSDGSYRVGQRYYRGCSDEEFIKELEGCARRAVKVR